MATDPSQIQQLTDGELDAELARARRALNAVNRGPARNTMLASAKATLVQRLEHELHRRTASVADRQEK